MSERAYRDAALPGPGTWVVDSTASYVRFELRRLWGLLKVRAEFGRFAGALVVDLDSVKADLTIDASSVRTTYDAIERHLRSSDFFDVERYPTIRFAAATVEPTDAEWIVTGDLAICDADLRLELPVKVFEDVERLTALMQIRIACRGGLNWRRLGMLGSSVVVRIGLSLERDEQGSIRPLFSVGHDLEPLAPSQLRS
jgi:polyisoprenoid-binding protein YceI